MAAQPSSSGGGGSVSSGDEIELQSGAGQGSPEAGAATASGGMDSGSQVAAAKSGSQKAQEFANRVIFGTLLGLAGAAVILYGRFAVLAVVVLVTYQATQEYYGFITSKQMSKGMTPPPPLVSAATTVLCVSMAFISYFHKGKSSTVLAVASFLLLVMDVISIKKPKFSQLASSLFGLFYCGWLPSFWLKLRMIPTPAPDMPLPAALAGLTTWTVGLVATLTAVACVIAADTGAYFVGKTLGRTKLTDISPKKTVEGAAGGMAASVLVALGSWKALAWPATPLAAVGLGVVIFFSSLFGDLIESIMKRDAGMKDSGDLIPGHGGLLDRFDSYIFTGAVVYFYTTFVMPWLSMMV